MLGPDEADFIRHTEGTFKLGIRFDGWGGEDRSYFRPFGEYGRADGAIRANDAGPQDAGLCLPV